MLVFIAIVLFLVWLFAVIVFHTLKGLIHLLLLIALIVLIVRFVRGRPAIGDGREP